MRGRGSTGVKYYRLLNTMVLNLGGCGEGPPDPAARIWRKNLYPEPVGFLYTHLGGVPIPLWVYLGYDIG